MSIFQVLLKQPENSNEQFYFIFLYEQVTTEISGKPKEIEKLPYKYLENVGIVRKISFVPENLPRKLTNSTVVKKQLYGVANKVRAHVECNLDK